MKQCSKCKQTKPIFEFFVDNRNKTKKSSCCKICHVSSAYVTKEDHIRTLITQIKHRAKTKNIPFNISLKYLLSIKSDVCPVFNTELLWAQKRKKNDINSPSLDRIIPKLGYVEGNVAFISFKANNIKSDANCEELEKVLNWLKQYD